MGHPLWYFWASLVAQLVKNPPAMQETGLIPGFGRASGEGERLPTPVFLAWRIPPTPGFLAWRICLTFDSLQPLGCKESDAMRLSLSWIQLGYFYWIFSCSHLLFLWSWSNIAEANILPRAQWCLEWILKLFAHLLQGLKAKEAHRVRVRKSKANVWQEGHKRKPQSQHGWVTVHLWVAFILFSWPLSIFLQVRKRASTKRRQPAGCWESLIKTGDGTLFLSFIFLNLIPAGFQAELPHNCGETVCYLMLEKDSIYSFGCERWSAH